MTRFPNADFLEYGCLNTQSVGCNTAFDKVSIINQMMGNFLRIFTIRVMWLEILLFLNQIHIFAIDITFFMYALHKMSVEISPAS